jgi:hypothetical protein
LKDPSFRPKAGPLATRAAIAGALYVIAPPAALLALIETGPGGKVLCGPEATDAPADSERTHSASKQADEDDDGSRDDESATEEAKEHAWKSPTG